MNVKLYITKTTAQAAVMQHLFNGGKKLNAKTFTDLIRAFVGSYGESYNDNFFSDYEGYEKEAEKIVNKYYN